MALVVITLQDEDDGRVDCKFLFEPLLKDRESTPAQMMAGRVLEALKPDAFPADDSGTAEA